MYSVAKKWIPKFKNTVKILRKNENMENQFENIKENDFSSNELETKICLK